MGKLVIWKKEDTVMKRKAKETTRQNKMNGSDKIDDGEPINLEEIETRHYFVPTNNTF